MNKYFHIDEEAARCLLCADAPCSKACGKGDVARAIQAVRFGNEKNAAQWVKGCTASDLAAAQEACIHYDRPIRISEIMAQLPEYQEKQLPSLEIDFCGIKCENPFFPPSTWAGQESSTRPSAWRTSLRCRHALIPLAIMPRATFTACATWNNSRKTLPR